MQETVKIGIVIPVLNEVENLRKLLRSIDQQSDCSFIHRIVLAVGDDVLTEYETLTTQFNNLHGKIILLQNKKKITPAALNLGIEKCASENINIIQFLGAHSIINREFISNLANHACEYPDVDIFNSAMEFTAPENSTERAIQLFTYSRLGRNWRSFFKEAKKGFITGIFAVRTEVFEKAGLFDERFIKNQDIEFVKRALNKGFSVRLFSGMVFYYKVRPTIPAALKQMFITGKYISIGFSSAGLKHLAPFLFYSLLLLILALYIITGVTFFLVSVISVIGIYILVNIFEAIRFILKKEKAAWILPLIFIGSHLYYAGGTFHGLYKRLLKGK
jgi:GT2 family glycosyltransferase